MTLPIRVLPFWLYGGAMGPGSRQGAVPAGVRLPLRRRKVRQASFPSAAKTAPAPLLLLSHRAGRGGSPLWQRQKENAPRPVEERKSAWTRSGAVALRTDGGRRTGACSDLDFPSGTL